MIKIAFVVRSLDVGGAERQLVSLVNGLNREKYDPRVFTFYSGGALEAELQDKGIQITNLEKKSRWDVFGFLWRLRKELDEFQPAICQSFLTVPNIVTTIASIGRPSMKTVWGIRAAFMNLSHYDWLARVTASLERGLARLPAAIIANAEAARVEYGLSKGVSKTITVIPNGIDTARFRPAQKSSAQVRHQFGLSPEDIVIGTVARLDPMKGHEKILEAARVLTKTEKQIRFLMVGGGSEEYSQHLLSISASSNLCESVVWAGEQQCVEDLIHAMDIHVLASEGEGFPNAVAETMSAGIPNVATAVGDVPDIIGNTGRIVPTNDPAAFTDALRDLIKLDAESRRVLGQKARQRIVDLFSRESMIKRYDAIYQGMRQESLGA